MIDKPRLRCIRCGNITDDWVSSLYPKCERCSFREINLWRMDKDFEMIMGGC